ncbi:apoptotic chromatin condensation inducer in the nucleus isoform X2 [Eurosta solidaginis]|uniref:apoptotic chromatin condensation inducer in the nucleus isoform X2 n=1 Tax=Eurosta solidaginis TaxID=178769 RepID=UPI0035311871
MMRRRSERKKSTDVSSPAPAATRRTSRRSRKTSETASEKGVHAEMSPQPDDAEKSNSNPECVKGCSNQESTVETRRSRSRNRTPVSERNSPASRKVSATTCEPTIDVIPEENNSFKDADEESKNEIESTDNEKNTEQEDAPKSETDFAATASCSSSPKMNVDIIKPLDVLEIQAEDNDEEKMQSQDAPSKDETPVNNSEEAENKSEEKEVVTTEEGSDKVEMEVDDKTNTTVVDDKPDAPSPKCVEEISTQEKIDENVNKRKWITKRTVENRSPLLVITTETVTPENRKTSDVAEVTSEREEGEQTPSPEREMPRPTLITTEKKIITLSEKMTRNQNQLYSAPRNVKKVNIKVEKRSPSPHKKASNILYITNLVRPFTVMQLKGLLARTGKMVEDGFWIDRIKSKCYVQYETEDEAVETRHALHGVRWPVSNPKCLIVNFARKSDMDRAIQSTKEEQSNNFGQESHRDNVLIGMGWNRDRNGLDEKRTIRPVREWDVGKKETLEREKSREILKRRSREREIFFGNREHDRNGKERRPRSKGRGDARSNSRSPVRKVKKKENDPPTRLLDDLFRKTKSSPCIYWLPLTPEQIAEKESFRQKRLEEHKQRLKQRELEKEKEREKERNRTNERRDREREKDHRRNRSSDRRSRSRDRRRY